MTRKKTSVVSTCHAANLTAVPRNPAVARQAGNTLVWSLVVLGGLGVVAVLIWLALGMLERSRINSVIESLNGTAAAVFAYQDRYGRTPGDDGPAASLAARGTHWSTVTAGDVDGRLDIGINQLFTGNGESGPFWQQLRASGFWSGDPAVSGQAALPRNPWGGLLSALADEMGGGLAGNKVCTSQVPGAAALAIDLQLDDGDGATGRLRATPGNRGVDTNPSNAPLSRPYSEEVDYTICYRM
ncbi:MAG: prepilin-type cleavage/methylation domain-containing protein [Gammaproteobacteria bacterium]|jgi:hypothetical protein